MADFTIRCADFENAEHARAVVDLVDSYARNPADGAPGLAKDVARRLAPALARHPGAWVFLAFRGQEAVGVAICFQGFSTFSAKGLLNIHDLVVAEGFRGQGVGRALLDRVERKARELGFCKLTLEVEESNQDARNLYRRVGFRGPDSGKMYFLSKAL